MLLFAVYTLVGSYNQDMTCARCATVAGQLALSYKGRGQKVTQTGQANTLLTSRLATKLTVKLVIYRLVYPNLIAHIA